MNHDDRDPDVSRDAWMTDDIGPCRLARRTAIVPPAIVAAEEKRLAEARAARVEPTPEVRKARDEAGMDRLRAAAMLNLFRESRRH